MTDKEKILAEIERLKSFYVQNVNEAYRDFTILLLDSVVDSINSLPAEQPSEDLEEAANLYAIKQGLELKPFARRFFIAGAQWQKEQMMKSAVDATCVLLPPPDVFKVLICHEVTDKLTVGKKVKILIVKEDEQ